uniref:GCS light chain n=1 Tax=Steinernema glaseri TaxID=37863 RepID=A0A1I7ZWI4_9BILA
MSDSSALMKKLQNLKSFRIHTGNINSFAELKLKRFKNSAEELSACLDLQFRKLDHSIDIGPNNTVLLSECLQDIVYDRDDLKISLKVFLTDFDCTQITNAIDATLDQLKTDSIEQIIVAFPEIDGESEEHENAWIQNVISLWKNIETLIDVGKVVSAGVADLQFSQLEKLYDEAYVKPRVNHFNIEGCCVVPPELQTYAREHDIQLLTHNDPSPFPVKEVFTSVCEHRCDSQPCGFGLLWAARYTVWVQRRSIMASKGYILEFNAQK